LSDTLKENFRPVMLSHDPNVSLLKKRPRSSISKQPTEVSVAAVCPASLMPEAALLIEPILRELGGELARSNLPFDLT
jgi:hypothetical protein